MAAGTTAAVRAYQFQGFVEGMPLTDAAAIDRTLAEEVTPESLPLVQRGGARLLTLLNDS